MPRLMLSEESLTACHKPEVLDMTRARFVKARQIQETFGTSRSGAYEVMKRLGAVTVPGVGLRLPIDVWEKYLSSLERPRVTAIPGVGLLNKRTEGRGEPAEETEDAEAVEVHAAPDEPTEAPVPARRGRRPLPPKSPARRRLQEIVAQVDRERRRGPK